MSPSQEIFTAMLVALREKYQGKPEVYDGFLPPAGTPYPFIYVSDTQHIPSFDTKQAAFGKVSLSIDVWHNNVRQRGVLTNLLFEIQQLAATIHYTDSYAWHICECSESVLADNTTSEPLMRGVLYITFKHYWR
jgi:hypothetical protein